MFCQQLSKTVIKETQNTLIEAMAGWLNKREVWGPRTYRSRAIGRQSQGSGQVAEREL